MNGSDKIQLMMLMCHLENLKLMSKCTPMPFSQASEELDRTDGYFYYDDSNPRKSISDISYPVLHMGCEYNSLEDNDDTISNLYMESYDELDGLHIDVVITEHDNHKMWHIVVYDEDYDKAYLNGKFADYVMIMDGELTL